MSDHDIWGPVPRWIGYPLLSLAFGGIYGLLWVVKWWRRR